MSASAWAYSNGEIVPLEEARYWPNDLAIIYGEIVYEATRTFGGKPFKLKEHIDRLYRSLDYCRLDPGLSSEELTEVTLEVVERNSPDLPDGSDTWIFHNITRGSHPQFPDVGRGDAGPSVLVWTHELGFKYWYRAYQDGAHCVTPSIRQVNISTQDPRMKTRSRMFLALAEQEVNALAPGAFTLLLDTEGRIAEATGANFMVVSDGAILTPRTGTGLAGVSLSTVRDLSLDLGVEVREADLTLYDVFTADEAFLSSTPYCMLPVTRVNGTQVGTGHPGELFARLIDAWSETVGVNIIDQARRLGEAT
jgi:branched-chain amino acid aminotransferase